jgi:hypothetical protein
MVINEIIDQINKMSDIEKAKKVDEIEKQRASIPFSEQMLRRTIEMGYDKEVCEALGVSYLPENKEFRKLFIYAYMTLDK